MRIIFKQVELDKLTVGSSLLISTIEACTQSEKEHEVLILNEVSNKEPRMAA